ncbi:MAG: hypothetical protein PVJ67_01005 [Candidatus Pacearchaeota archaeon]|jgi:hypothetical protein
MKEINKLDDLMCEGKGNLIIIKGKACKFNGIDDEINSNPEIQAIFVDEKELFGGSLYIKNYKTDEEGNVTGEYSSREIPGFSKRFGVTIAEMDAYERGQITKMEEERARRKYA